MNIEARALQFLMTDPLQYMDMLTPLKRGSAVILYAAKDGILLHETKSGAYMMSVASEEKGCRLLSEIAEGSLFLLHQAFMAEHVRQKYGLHTVHTCVQAVYFAEPRLPLADKLHIRKLGPADFAIIHNHYHTLVDADYIRRRLADEALFGGFYGEALCGFIGEHEEGSIGMLEIFTEYRGLGFGTELTAYMTNNLLDRGMVPFSQIVPGNTASERLHVKLGYTIGRQLLHWLF